MNEPSGDIFMYYRLNEPWAFRGWKKLPYALRAEDGERKYDKPKFFDKEIFLLLLNCNGETDLDLSGICEADRKILEELTQEGILQKSQTKLPPLHPAQRYHVYPSRCLQSVHWSITGKCNFQCRHCLVSAPEARHPQLPLEDCLHIIDSLAECGVLQVEITGGEPLLRDDFEQIVAALSGYHIEISVLFTNASLLTPAVLDMLKRYHQNPVFQLSFDGLGHHDWLRGVPGAEKEADAAFRLLRERGFSATAAMCIHKENRHCLRDTVQYLSDLNVLSLRVNAPQVMGVWKQYADQYALSEKEVWSTYRTYIPRYFADGMPIDLELDGYFRCKKGSVEYSVPYYRSYEPDMDWHKAYYCESLHFNAYISPEARLVPCMGFSDHPVLRDKFPDILHKPLSEVTRKGFYYDLAGTRISDLLEQDPECKACEHLPHCGGGCMAESITDDGKMLASATRCCFFHKHVGRDAVSAVADQAIRAMQKNDK